MRSYAPNSPEALSRIVAMMIVADAMIDDREIETLDAIGAFATLGISRKSFLVVARDYCRDLVQHAEQRGSTPLIDPERTDWAINEVTDQSRRTIVAKLLSKVAAADREHNESEVVLLAHIFDRWNIVHDNRAELPHDYTST